MRRALIVLAAAAVLAGCGNDRTPAPDVGLIPAPRGFRAEVYRAQGIALRVPTNWRVRPADAPPQLSTIAAGDAQIAVWRYPRTEPLPETRAQLDAAREALVKQVQGRDATFELTSSRVVIRRGLKGVELVGVGTNITNQAERRSVRSLHAYAHGAEVVLDAFAPTKEFARIDQQTFRRVTRSLKLTTPKS